MREAVIKIVIHNKRQYYVDIFVYYEDIFRKIGIGGKFNFI